MRIRIDPDCLVAPLRYVADNYAPEITQSGMDFSKAT